MEGLFLCGSLLSVNRGGAEVNAEIAEEFSESSVKKRRASVIKMTIPYSLRTGTIIFFFPNKISGNFRVI